MIVILLDTLIILQLFLTLLYIICYALINVSLLKIYLNSVLSLKNKNVSYENDSINEVLPYHKEALPQHKTGQVAVVFR